MILTDILLIVLVLTVLYATYVLRQRIIQMRELKNAAEKSMEEMAVLKARPPSASFQPNPQIVELEKQLDELDLTPTALWELRTVEIEQKENEIIHQMVDIFMREADKRLVSNELKSLRSGSDK